MKSDDKLRETSLVFYKEDIDKIEHLMGEFLNLSKAKCSLLIDKDGHFITKQGHTGTYNMDTISALVAGSFAATKEMAKILGEKEFSVLFHQGVKDNIQLSLIGDRTILAVIFDNTTTLGMVRLYVNETMQKLNHIFGDIKKRRQAIPAKEIPLSQAPPKDTQEKLDDIFGKE